MDKKTYQFVEDVVLDNCTDVNLKVRGLQLLLDEAAKGTLPTQEFKRASEEFNLSFDDWSEMQTKLIDNGKIPAIKAFRDATGFGLKESKRAVENPLYFKQPS